MLLVDSSQDDRLWVIAYSLRQRQAKAVRVPVFLMASGCMDYKAQTLLVAERL